MNGLLVWWRGRDVRRDLYDRIIELGNFDEGDSFAALPKGERLARGAVLADCWEQLAADCDRSAAVRLQFGSWSPETMRLMAAQYRAGCDPYEQD